MRETQEKERERAEEGERKRETIEGGRELKRTRKKEDVHTNSIRHHCVKENMYKNSKITLQYKNLETKQGDTVNSLRE